MKYRKFATVSESVPVKESNMQNLVSASCNSGFFFQMFGLLSCRESLFYEESRFQNPYPCFPSTSSSIFLKENIHNLLFSLLLMNADIKGLAESFWLLSRNSIYSGGELVK